MTAVSYPYIYSDVVSLFYGAKYVSPPGNLTKGNDVEGDWREMVERNQMSVGRVASGEGLYKSGRSGNGCKMMMISTHFYPYIYVGNYQPHGWKW